MMGKNLPFCQNCSFNVDPTMSCHCQSKHNFGNVVVMEMAHVCKVPLLFQQGKIWLFGGLMEPFFIKMYCVVVILIIPIGFHFVQAKVTISTLASSDKSHFNVD